MVRRKISRTRKGANSSRDKINRATKKRARVSSVGRKVATSRPNKKNQRSVKKPGVVTSRFRKAVSNSNIKSSKSDRIHETGRATRKTTRISPRKERSIYVK